MMIYAKFSQLPLPTNNSSSEHLADLEEAYQIPQRTVCILTWISVSDHSLEALQTESLESTKKLFASF
jgi:hypothetical protein